MKRKYTKIIAVILVLAYCVLLDFIEVIFVKINLEVAVLLYIIYVVLAIPAIKSSIDYFEYCSKDENCENKRKVYWKLQSNIFRLYSICFFSIGIKRLILYKDVFVIFLLVGIFFFMLHKGSLKLSQ